MAIKFFRTRDKYGCFSNFSRHSVWYENYTWPTTEHYFQAQKYAGLPGLAIERYNAIRTALTPRCMRVLIVMEGMPVNKDRLLGHSLSFVWSLKSGVPSIVMSYFKFI